LTEATHLLSLAQDALALVIWGVVPMMLGALAVSVLMALSLGRLGVQDATASAVARTFGVVFVVVIVGPSLAREIVALTSETWSDLSIVDGGP